MDRFDRNYTPVLGFDEFTPGDIEKIGTFPPVDNMPNNKQYSWNEDLQLLRNQFPFVQIDPPIAITTRVRLDRASATDLRQMIPVPANAQAFRITFHSNNAQVTLGISLADSDNTQTTLVYESNQIINPTANWRYCRNTSSIMLYIAGPGATGVIHATIEWYCQL